VLLYIYYAVLAFLCPITVYIEPQRFINLPHYSTTLKKQKLTADTVVNYVAALRFLCVKTLRRPLREILPSPSAEIDWQRFADRPDALPRRASGHSS
jgi:hypothetical protein